MFIVRPFIPFIMCLCSINYAGIRVSYIFPINKQSERKANTK